MDPQNAVLGQIEQQVMQATKVIEQQLDDELGRLDKMDDDDLERLRVQRLQQLKKSHQQKQDWLSQGHGEYTELSDEKEFFEACKKSKNIVCHFYRDSTMRCKIVDMHLGILAKKHLEARFLKINVEKAKFLVERLRVRVMPTICLARDGQTVDYIVGFEDLGNTDEFPTEMLEWRIALKFDIIQYQGDKSTPPFTGKIEKKDQLAGILGHKKPKNLRDEGDDSSDDDDW